MKKIIRITMLLMLILTISVPAKAASGEQMINTLVYLDTATGQKVEFRDDSQTTDDMVKKWLSIASRTFRYHGGKIQLLSLKESKRAIKIDLSSNFHDLDPTSDEFEMFMWSIQETIFMNTDVSTIYFYVEGRELENVGEFSYTEGVNRVSRNQSELDNLIRSIPNVPNPTIVIDPGHGGIWNNATAADGTKEKDIVLEVGNFLKADLQNKGATVIMTRSTDTYFSSNLSSDLAARVNIANDNNADLFISLHCNGGGTGADGTEAFWPTNHHVSTSTSLANEITAKITSRHGTDQRWNREGNYQVLRDTDMTAVLVELAYITDPTDYQELDSVADRDAMAYSVYLGIRKFWWGY